MSLLAGRTMVHKILILISQTQMPLLTAQAYIQQGMRSNFWSEPSSISILHTCQQQRLWQVCTYMQTRLSLCYSLIQLVPKSCAMA